MKELFDWIKRKIKVKYYLIEGETLSANKAKD